MGFSWIVVFFAVSEGIFLMSAISECTSREGISETVVLGVVSEGVTAVGVSEGVIFFAGMNDLALVDRPNLRENVVSVGPPEGVLGVGDVSAGVRDSVDLVAEFLVDEILSAVERLGVVLLARTREARPLLVEILVAATLLEAFVVALLFFSATSGCVVLVARTCDGMTLVTGSRDGLLLLAETREAVVLTAELGESVVVAVVALCEAVVFVTGPGEEVFLMAGICDRELDRSSDVLVLDRRLNKAG